MGRPVVDLINERFGTLVVLYRDTNSTSGRGKHARWICRCDCGKTVSVMSHSLRMGKAQSCGCRKGNNKHSGRYSRLYSIWTNMKTRTTNPNSVNWGNYGGRGIVMCREWLNDFEAFRNWALSAGYHDGLSIDRIDNNGDYRPDNCRWATAEEQNSNTRTCMRIEYLGKRKTLNGWARKLGLNASTIHRRMQRGMSFEQAIG